METEIKISIHVPAWGTTISLIVIFILYKNFNPRSRVGNDHGPDRQGEGVGNFNPRSRVGNDLIILHSDMLHLYFNPRSRVGNDSKNV